MEKELVKPHHLQDIALIDGDLGSLLTYQDLQARIEQMAPLLNRAKALFFLFIRPSIECVVAYLSLLKYGHAVALFDSALHPELKARLIKKYSPEYIISHPETLTDSSDDIALAENYSPEQHLEPLRILKAQKEQIAPLHPELQLLLSTSGTTGSPKLIRLSKKNIVSNAASIAEYLNIAPSDRALASLSFSYSYGLSVLHSHLIAGACVVLTSQSVVQQGFWTIANTFGCTSMAGVPYTYQLLDRLGIEKLLPPTLKVLTQAGGRLGKDLTLKLHEMMARRQGLFYPMYGQTEATARIAFLPPSYLPQKAGAIGIPIPGGKLQLFANGKEIVEAYKEGELVYTGSNVMLGYAAERHDLALGDQLHGTLQTGDVGFCDDDGVYFLTGRMKRISKVYGQRINLDEIEAALSAYGRVAAVSDDTTIRLYFESDKEDFSECIVLLSRLFHLSATTFECIRLPHLPLTVSGKIDYTQLKVDNEHR